MYPPQKFMMATFAEVPRAVIPPSPSAVFTPITQPARSRSHRPTWVSGEQKQRHVPRAMLATTSDGPCDRPLSPYSDQRRVWG